MIPILYEQLETEFKTNGIGRLSDAISCTVNERKNDSYKLDMSYPVTGKYFNELKPGRIVYATHDNSGKPQPFDIVSVSSPSRGQVRVTAEHISRRLQGVLTKLNRQWWTTGDTVSLFFDDLNDKSENGYIIGNCPFSFHTDIDDAKSGYYPKRDSFISVYDHLLDSTYGILSVENGAGVNGEFEFDTFDVHLHKNRGSYDGVKMRTGKNVRTLTIDTNNKNIISGVLAFWHGNDPIQGIERTITITGDTASTLDKDDFGSQEDILSSGLSVPYQKVVQLDLSSKFSYPPSPDEIREEAEFYLTQQKELYSYDSASYSIDLVYNSDNTTELQSADLCDWVIVEDVTLRVQKKLQITEVVYDTLRNRYTSMCVGTLQKTFKQLVHNESSSVNTKADNIQSQVRDLATKTDVDQKVYPASYDPQHPEDWDNSQSGPLYDSSGREVEQIATVNRKPVFVYKQGGSGSISECVKFFYFNIQSQKLENTLVYKHHVDANGNYTVEELDSSVINLVGIDSGDFFDMNADRTNEAFIVQAYARFSIGKAPLNFTVRNSILLNVVLKSGEWTQHDTSIYGFIGEATATVFGFSGMSEVKSDNGGKTWYTMSFSSGDRTGFPTDTMFNLTIYGTKYRK